MSADLIAAAGDQLPEDVGKSGPLGLLLTLLLLIAVFFLVRSMGKHLKRVPPSFDPADRVEEIPDTPAELFESPTAGEPGGEVMDTLRRAPRAIEPPRRSDDRPDAPAAGAGPPGAERVRASAGSCRTPGWPATP